MRSPQAQTIWDYLLRTNSTQVALARKAGISVQCLNRILSGERLALPRTLEKIYGAMAEPTPEASNA